MLARGGGGDAGSHAESNGEGDKRAGQEAYDLLAAELVTTLVKVGTFRCRGEVVDRTVLFDGEGEPNKSCCALRCLNWRVGRYRSFWLFVAISRC